MKYLKKCPLFLLLFVTGALLSLAGAGGLKTIYAGQAYDPLTAPVLSVVFTGIKDEIYPWQIFSGDKALDAMAGGGEASPGEQPLGEGKEGTGLRKSRTVGIFSDTLGSVISGMEEEAKKAEEEAEKFAPIAPLRETTREEYLNHVSADIYGDAGVLRAGEYAFATVDESYFDDAMFIGDSRTVGLRDYTDMSERADFFCETSLTIYGALEEDFEGVGTVKEALAQKDYGKIYLMVGINELGRGTTESFMEEYTKTVNTLRELEPEAKIFIQGIMRVAGEKDEKDPIFNNSNINARNNAIATLADNKHIFYIDVNEAVCDGQGNLNSEYTFDKIHLLGAYNVLWKEFLLTHGVEGQ